MTLALCVERDEADSDAQLPALVCLHGWGMNLRVFDGLRAGLRDEWQTWAIDLPGHGKSPWRDERSGLATQVEDLLAAMPPRCTVVAWSLGGQFALEMAARAPQQIAALVLVATTPRFKQGDDWPQGLDEKAVDTFRMMLDHDWRQTLSDFVWLQLRGSRNAQALQKQIESALQSHGLPQPHAMSMDLALMGKMDQRALLPRIAQPALIITGQNDRVTPPAAGEYLAREMPRACCVEIGRAGHAPFASHTEECLAHIRPFLRELAREVA